MEDILFHQKKNIENTFQCDMAKQITMPYNI